MQLGWWKQVQSLPAAWNTSGTGDVESTIDQKVRILPSLKLTAKAPGNGCCFLLEWPIFRERLCFYPIYMHFTFHHIIFVFLFLNKLESKL